MPLTWETMQQMGDDARVNIALRPLSTWDGKRIHPRLWEALRIEMQDRYRRATGEEFAIVVIENGGPDG